MAFFRLAKRIVRVLDNKSFRIVDYIYLLHYGRHFLINVISYFYSKSHCLDRGELTLSVCDNSSTGLVNVIYYGPEQAGRCQGSRFCVKYWRLFILKGAYTRTQSYLGAQILQIIVAMPGEIKNSENCEKTKSLKII